MSIAQQTPSDNNVSPSTSVGSSGACEECGSCVDTTFHREEHGKWTYEYFLCADCARVFFMDDWDIGDDDPIDSDEDRGV